MNTLLRSLFILLLFSFFADLTFAKQPESVQPTGESTKNMDFDGEVVEGINKQPLDSLNSISETDEKTKLHLYRKGGSYKSDNQDRVRGMLETY